MRPATLTIAFFVTIAVLTTAVRAKEGSVLEWLQNNKDTTRAAALLASLYTKPIPPTTTMTFLVPTNQAIDEWEKGMGLTQQQVLARRGLIDLVMAYHVIPGYQAKELKLKQSMATATTGDINYILRFHQTPKGVVVQDLQDNNVTLTKAPVLINKVSLVVINRVLMSGSYFFTGKDALSYYPQWGSAAAFAEAAGFPEGVAANNDLTLFVPDDAAFKGIKTDGLSAAQKADIVRYHVVTPARFIPTDFKNGALPTAFKGHSLTVAISTDTSKTDPVTGKANAIPTITLTPEAGKPATVNLYNIYVGRGIFQGVSGVLMPNLAGGAASPKTTTEAAKKADTTAAATASKASTAKPAAAKAPAQPAAKPAGAGNRRLLGWVVDAARSALDGVFADHAGRRLLGRGRGYSGDGYSQQYANTVAQDNTARAIEAAATGSIPTSYATRYGSVQAKTAATYGDCLNCNLWS